jgi:lysophospholipase L1-like esterase
MSGVVALGDSITAAESSWAQWVARALGLPHTSYAVNGAVVAHVLRKQLPRVRPGYDVALLYAGVNDARSPAFDPAAYERDLGLVAEDLRERAERLLLVTLPLRLGEPTAAPKPEIANAAVRRIAAATGAALCELDDLQGDGLLERDLVHPTAAGQLAIADRAARVLGAPRLPSALGIR